MMPESDAMLVVDRQLDASGWLCPRPVIEAQRMLRRMAAGANLEVLLTDPHGPLDFQVYCERGGLLLHKLEECGDAGQPRWRIILGKP